MWYYYSVMLEHYSPHDLRQIAYTITANYLQPMRFLHNRYVKKCLTRGVGFGIMLV